MTLRLALVVQRFGLEVNGGSETLCRQVAERLALRTKTEVLTTCALDYTTWADHFPPGEERIGELLVRRFPVDRPRVPAEFGALSESLRPRIGQLSPAEEERWMREQGPWSPQLFDYIEAHAADYDAFIFFTYLYASTYFGLPRVAEKSVLVPTAHDEWPIYFAIWDRLMDLPRAFIFQTPEELQFMRRRFPHARLEGPTPGIAVEPPEHADAGSFRRKHGIAGPFVLYAGRLDASKGVGQLIEFFDAYRRETGDAETQLVLVGKPVMEIPRHPWLRPLGFLSEQEKWEALSACEALMMPSPYESFSIATVEAWTMGKPVLANAQCEVLVGQCRRSNGGLWYRDAAEFSLALETLLRDEALRRGIGAQGRDYAQANYRWPKIIDAYYETADTVGR
jgi:glycosyltransferase involved in cell wall biosynthesis